MSEEHPQQAQKAIEKIVREEWGRVLSILVGQINDIHLAEDALQDALIAALEQWSSPESEVPTNPAAWLLKVAKRKMIDQIRRRENFRSKEEAIIASIEEELSSNQLPEFEEEDPMTIPDERMRLICTCCHPALAEESRIALTLQTLGGLQTQEVARAFLIPEPTMAQRLVRAKRKIKTAGIPYEVPAANQLSERLDSILAVIYFIFNEGYAASSGEDPVRVGLCDEAIRLGRILISLQPDHAEAKGLLALMLLHHARTPARQSKVVTIEHQDRTQWDQEKISLGLVILEAAMAEGSPGSYQIQAAISALHCEAEDYDATDWSQIYFLYQRLHSLNPSPIIALNASVALSFAKSPEAALEALAKISDHPNLANYLPFFAAKADFHRRAGNPTEASKNYQTAIRLANNSAEREFLQNRLDTMR